MHFPRFTIRRLMIVIAVTGLALGLLQLHLGTGFILFYASVLFVLAWSFVRIQPNLATRAFIPAAILLDLSLIGEFAYMPLFHKSLSFVGSLALLPIVPALGLAWIITREGRAARFKAALIVVAAISVAASVLMTHWPLRLAFYVSSPALNRLADRVEAGGTLSRPEWAGLYRIYSVQPFTSGDLMLRVNPTKGQMAGFMRKSGLAKGVGRESLYYGPEWGERWNYRDSW